MATQILFFSHFLPLALLFFANFAIEHVKRCLFLDRIYFRAISKKTL